jgi:hypothetical protein
MALAAPRGGDVALVGPIRSKGDVVIEGTTLRRIGPAFLPTLCIS